MSTLHDRLADLAEEAPAAGPPQHAPGLWERGLRYRRVRRTGTLIVLGSTVLVLALLGGITWQRAAPPVQPAGGPVGLPDRVWDPSPWLPTTDRPGRLVAIDTAAQGSWTGKHTAAVGISATTGEYAFLDLPDAKLDTFDGPRLSPDGRHIAYWLTGRTTGTPNTSEGPPIAGVAIYDTGSGRVVRHPIATAHGLRPDFLAWADPTTVAYSAYQIVGGDDASLRKQDSGRAGPMASWSLSGEPERLPRRLMGDLQGAGHGRILVGTSSSDPARAYRLLDLHRPSASHFVDFPSSSGALAGLRFVSVDASGRRIALVPGNKNPAKVQAGRIGHLRVVPNTRGTWGVVDWLDPDTIVTLRRARDRAEAGSGLYRVSVATGRSTKLVTFPRFSHGGGWQFATDLLDAPSVHATKPPRPVDPRWVTGLAVTTVLGALAGVLLWRRRFRP